MNGLCNDKVINDLEQMFIVKSGIPIFFQYPLGSHETTEVSIENDKLTAKGKRGRYAFIIGAEVSFMDSEEVLQQIEQSDGKVVFTATDRKSENDDLVYIGLAFLVNGKITLPLIEVFFTQLEIYTYEEWNKKEPTKIVPLEITEEGFSFEGGKVVQAALCNYHLNKFNTDLESIPFDSEFYFFDKDRKQVYVASFTYES